MIASCTTIAAERHPRRQRPRGLALIDVVVAVLLLGIITAAGGLRYSSALQTATVRQAAQRMAIEIEAARNTARTRRQQLTIAFNTTNHSYSIAGLADADHPAATRAVVLQDYSPQLRLTSASFGGDAQLRFNEWGHPDSGGTAVISYGSTTQSVVVAAQTGSVSVP